MTLASRILSLLLLASATVSCSERTSASAAAPAAVAPAPGASAPGSLKNVPLIAPYPYAAWRLGDRGELEHVVLWFSHILVRYQHGFNDEVSFNLSHFHSVLPEPTRDRDTALALARDVAARARKDPASFPALARELSEDLSTRDQGGSLGGVTASQLTLWPQVLDTLAAIHPGEVSEVVESWYGFHVFYRSPPPAEETLSGSYVVIGHDQARWPGQARGEPSQRTRAAALTLATRVYDMARQAPSQFELLVDRYSEHRTAQARGDFGSYSSHEPTWCPREAEVLRQLAVGEVAPPLDSPVGFEIIRRTPNRTRRSYAMDSLWLTFDPAAAEGEPNSRGSVLARASALAESIHGDPERFAEAQRDTCCAYVKRWQEGREAPALQAMLDTLKLGQVAQRPVQAEFSWVIVRRIAPEPAKALPTQFELPAPREPAFEYHFMNLPVPALQALMRGIGESAIDELALEGTSEGERLRALHQLPGLDDETGYVARRAMLDDFVSETQRVLDVAQLRRYRALQNRAFESYLLDPTNETAMPRVATIL